MRVKLGDIDAWRMGHKAIAEWVDGWRLIPRLLVAGYAYMMWVVVKWYMNLTPHMIEGCDIDKLGEACIAVAPNTQHAVVLTAVVGVAAAVFGLYTNSSKKFDDFKPWKKKVEEPAE